MAYVYPLKEATEELKLAVWRKGSVIPYFLPSVYRWDAYGSIMQYSEHGNTNSERGWEIDHIRPLVKGGSAELINLEPLQWQNNRYKGDS
jgi:hypothetical protein